MSVKIGDLLLKEGMVTLGQLEEALKYQVIFGGKLGTNLIEMGVLDEEEITRALSRKFGVPAADPLELTRIPADVIQLLPREIAEKYRAVPLRLEGRRLTLAMADPSELKAVDEISFRTGLIIRPQVAAEVRIVLALEQYYGVERERRYIHAAKKIAVRHKKAPDEKAALASPLAPAAEQLITPSDDLWGLEEATVEDLGGPAEPAAIQTAAPAAETEEVVELEEAVAHEEEKTAAAAQERHEDAIDTDSDELAAERLVEARDRDDILGAVAARLAAEFPRCALFLVRGEMALGWRCLIDSRPRPGFDAVQIPLDEPSALKTVAEGKSFYLGPIARTPFNSMMLQEMGGALPEAALLVPLLMMGRVVGILYVDGQGIDLGERLLDLQKLTAKAAMAFEILVLKNKILSL